MTSDSKAMMDILQNLQKVHDNTHPLVAPKSAHDYSTQSSGNVSPDAQAMYAILSKLETATEATNERINSEVNQGGELLLTETTDVNQFGVGQYNVAIEDSLLAGKYKKKYYTVKEGNVVLYKDLSLFESAMGIIKQLLENNNIETIRSIVRLDNDYDVQLNEAATQKKRTSTLTESVQIDVAAARHSSAISKMSNIKKQIKRLL